MRLPPVRRRIGALAVLTSSCAVFTAAATGSAGAAPRVGTPVAYQGATEEYGIHLALLGGLPGLGSTPGLPAGAIDIGLLHSTGATTSGTSGSNAAAAPQADSTSTLLSGTLADLARTDSFTSAIPSTSSSLANPGPNKAAGVLGLPTPLNVVLASAAVPDITATSTAGPVATTVGAVGLNASALNLGALVPTASIAPFRTGFQTVLAQISTLQTVIGQLNAVPGAAAATATLAASLTTLQAEAQQAFDQITTGALITATGLSTSHALTTTGGQQVSTAHAELGSLSLLGGFATVDGFNNTLTAYAGGSPGSAKVVPDVTNGGIGAVRIAGAGGALTGSGATINLGPLAGVLNGLGATTFTGFLTTGFQTLQTNLATLFTALAPTVTVAADTVQNQNVAADGTSASAQLPGLEIKVTLPDASSLGSLTALGGLPAAPSDLGSLANVPGLSGLSGVLRTLGAGVSTLTGALGALGAGSTPLSGLAPGAPVTPPASIANPLAAMPKSSNAAPSSAIGAAAVTPAATTATTAPVVDIALGSVQVLATATANTNPLRPTNPAHPGTPNAAGPGGDLAFTGANLPVTGGIAATLVLAGAYAARRRRGGSVPADES